MAQRSRRRKRKQRQADRAARGERAGANGREQPSAGYRGRSERRDAAARAKLEPLPPGDRPTAVTVGAIVAAALALVNVVIAIVGLEVNDSPPPVAGGIFFTGLMLMMAWGMWRSRYWAVLGMQALLGLALVVFGLLLIVASNVAAVVVSVIVLAGAGTLFWHLVKAMARIQMPERPGQ